MYFAYGSNINLDQMAYRCPAAQVVGPVVLEGYELLFRGNASGNGVATIKPKEGQQVHGLLWRITPGCERSLDLYEGYPHLYGNPQNRIHLTEKPLQLMRDVVKITEPGGRILDPFAGSGSTVLAAVLEGYSATGIEVTDAYAALSKERIARELAQGA